MNPTRLAGQSYPMFSVLFFLVLTGLTLTPDPLRARNLTYDTASVEVRTAEDTPLGRLTVRIANTPVKRYMGLRHVTTLDTDAGMFFIYPDSNHRNFTMEDMKIPLDILYLDESKQVLSIHSVRPGVSSIPSPEPARYVLEVNHGWSRSHNIQTGDKIYLAE